MAKISKAAGDLAPAPCRMLATLLEHQLLKLGRRPARAVSATGERG